MGKILQCAGGGKVTVEGLAAGNLRSGATVTVKQGSKVVQQVTGSLAVRRVFVGSVTATGTTNVTYTLSATAVPGWQYLTADHFCAQIVNETFTAWERYENPWRARVVPALSYNPANGIVSLSNLGWAQENWSGDTPFACSFKAAVNVYAYILG